MSPNRYEKISEQTILMHKRERETVCTVQFCANSSKNHEFYICSYFFPVCKRENGIFHSFYHYRNRSCCCHMECHNNWLSMHIFSLLLYIQLHQSIAVQFFSSFPFSFTSFCIVFRSHCIFCASLQITNTLVYLRWDWESQRNRSAQRNKRIK